MPKSINKGLVAIPIVAVSALLLMAPLLASAASPHFVRASSSQSGNNLVCSFKEAGLGSGTTVTVKCSADARAVYGCINGGEKHPKAANKETVNAKVSESGTFSSDKNGNVEGSLTVEPPDAGNFSCPPGQELRLLSVTYTNVEVCDTTNNVCKSA